MRLFTAINFNSDTLSKLLVIRDELKSQSSSGNFVLPENLHLTLVFLGDCDKKQADYVKNAMDDVKFAPFEILIERIGRFKRDNGDIWWAGIRENKPLQDMQRCLSENLIRAGFILENKQYKPHITLGRKVVTEMKPRQIEPFGQTCSSIDLMKSERINGKLIYTSIHQRNT